MVAMKSSTPTVITKGTVRQMYRENKPGNNNCGLSESCHSVPNNSEPASKIKGFHMEKKTSARAMNPQPAMKL